MEDPWSVDEEIRKQVEFHESSYVPKFPKTASKSMPMKNAVRKVPFATKCKVFARDGWKCVCCGTTRDIESVPHHAYYGWEANYGPDRNKPNQLVTICRECHRQIHFTGDPNGYREKCKLYLSNLFVTWTAEST